jgi:hypothetical protein
MNRTPNGPTRFQAWMMFATVSALLLWGAVNVYLDR